MVMGKRGERWIIQICCLYRSVTNIIAVFWSFHTCDSHIRIYYNCLLSKFTLDYFLGYWSIIPNWHLCTFILYNNIFTLKSKE